jgi:hypothetical protein
MTAVDQRLETDAQHPLMRALRVSAYQSCRDEGRHEYLGRLRVHVAASDYTDDELLTDLQQCATRLTWRVRAEDQSLDATGTLGGGASPGTETEQAATAGVAKGTITLGGDMRAFRCPDGSFAPDELIVTLDGTEVDRRQATGGSFYPSPHELDAETVLEAAGVDPYAIATIPLVIARESPNFGCALYTQSMAAIPLVTLNLGFPAPFAYFEDFDGAAGTEWSNPVVDVSPTGERFLGQFSSSAVMLTLGELPLHTQVTIEFDLYIIDGWNGEDDDTFTFRAGGQILKHTSFSNRDDRQAYPGDLPSRDYAAGTGASATDALGYPDHRQRARDRAVGARNGDPRSRRRRSPHRERRHSCPGPGRDPRSGRPPNPPSGLEPQPWWAFPGHHWPLPSHRRIFAPCTTLIFRALGPE